MFIIVSLSLTLPTRFYNYHIKNMAEEAEGRIKQVLQSQLSKLDLVTREEFDIQTQVLIKTREKLEAMEVRLAALEAEQAADD